MLRPSPNHGTQRLPNDDDDILSYCHKSEFLDECRVGIRTIVSSVFDEANDAL